MVDPETVPPFYQKFFVQQVIVDSVLPYTNPVNPVHDYHVKNPVHPLAIMNGM